MGIDGARRSRHRKSAALRMVADGRLSVTAILRQPPTALKTTDVWDVVLAAPGVGRSKARQVFEHARVFPCQPLGELSDPERRALIDCLVN